MALGGGFNFGAKPATTQATSTSTPGFSFGFQPSQTSIATTSVTPALGAPLLSTTSSAGPTGLGGGLFSTPASAGTTFKSTPTASTSATGFSFGGLPGGTSFGLNTTQATSQPSAGFNFGGAASTAAPTAGALPLQTATSTTVPKTVGLGGVDFSASANAGKDGADSKNEGKSVKATDAPNEITIAVDAFKKYVKEQKIINEEISRISSKPLSKVGEETAGLRKLVSVVSNGIQRNTSTVAKLKQESARELKNAEIAKQTKDLPAGMQYENTAPTEYFQRMVIEFERRMLSYKQQIEELEHHLVALNHSAPLNPNELTVMIKKIHETFVALAAELHTVNEGVRAQKEQYLHHRKTAYGDSRNIFIDRLKSANEEINNNKSKGSDGPSAFSHIPNAAAIAMITALNRNQQTPAPPTLGLDNPGVATSNASMFGNSQNKSLFSQSTGFGATPAPSFAFGGHSAIRPTTGFGSSLQQTPGFGLGQSTSGFGSNFSFGNTSAVRPLGNVGTGSLSAGPMIGGSSGFANTQGFGAMPVQNEPFVLQKPPLGTKRGKR